MAKPTTVSEVLLRQRVRNRLIEYFDFVSSFENIARAGAFEVINRWNDWVDDDASRFFTEPVFSQLEQATIRRFHATWVRCANQSSEDVFDIQTISKLECWRDLRDAAGSALNLLGQRGRFSEEEESF